MQKKLADYFRHLVDQGDEVLSEFYEPRALLRSDEAAIVTGLLLSLNVVDCNLCVKVILINLWIIWIIHAEILDTLAYSRWTDY